MITATDKKSRLPEFPACKIIHCVFPDDGTDNRVLLELRKKYGIVSAGTATRRGIAALGKVKTKRGKLPLPRLVKQVYVICPVDQQEEIFDFIFWFANIDKPDRGVMWQQDLAGSTPFELPPDVPDEETGA